MKRSDNMTTLEEYGEEKYNEGFKKGVEETRLEIARKLITKDVDLYYVSYGCHLGIATLDKLKESMGK